MTVTVYNPFVDRNKMRALAAFAAAIVDNLGPELGAVEAAGKHVLETSRPETDTHKDVQAIIRNTRAAAGVINYLSSIAGRQSVKPELLDVREILADLTPLLRRLLGENVMLDISCATDLWPIKADLQMFELVVLALSVNARDAMPHGGRLRWDASNIAADGRQALYSNEIPAADYIALGVADSGHGIPANLIDRVFEPLFSTKSERGSGTGLMTVYCALEQMNGQILIESEIDTGTLVRLFLPRADLLRL